MEKIIYQSLDALLNGYALYIQEEGLEYVVFFLFFLGYFI